MNATADVEVDLVAAAHPRRARVEGDFNIRGGIHTTVVAEYQST
jgi:NADPH-dependent 7-cyano-7-deazaguanine reductase QueF